MYYFAKYQKISLFKNYIKKIFQIGIFAFPLFAFFQKTMLAYAKYYFNSIQGF